MFGLETLFDEKDIYPYLHSEIFVRHMSRDICRTYIHLEFSPLDKINDAPYCFIFNTYLIITFK